MAWHDLRTVCDFGIEADSESPDVASFSHEASRATLVVNIAPRPGSVTTWNLLGPLLAILGAAHYDGRLTTRLGRILPCQHPMFGWMFATEIASIQGRGQIAGVPAKMRTLGGSAPNWQAYQTYRVVVVFSSVKYAVKKDSLVVSSELERYVERHYQLGLENILRQGNTFRWVPNVPGYAGQPIPQGMVARAKKGIVNYVWKQVPRFGLFGRSGDNWPLNIWNGVGKVNKTAFDGCEPGQLLLLPPKFTPLSTPYAMQSPGGNDSTVGQGQADLNLAYDVELPMEYIAPTKDPNFTYGAGGPDHAFRSGGHNLFPLPPGGTTNYWYPATRNAASTGDTLYEAYEFHDLFKLMGGNT